GHKHRRARPALLSLERLEDRTVPSAFASMTGAAEKFGVYEVVLSGNGQVANPFSTRATVTFTAPSGQAFTVNDFYDGGDTWRARAYVTEAGLWRWAASSASDPGLNGATGAFTATDTGLPGLLQLNPANPKAWVTQRGPPVLDVGEASWLLFNQNPGGAISWAVTCSSS